MDKLLRELVSCVSPSGREEAVAAKLAALGRAYGDVSNDPMGSLIIHKPGPGKKVMLEAHMDTVGLIVTYVEPEGFARFSNLGGLRPVMLLGQRVRFENGIQGVICADRGVKPEELRMDKLYLDTFGQTVRPGDTAVYCGEPYYAGSKVLSPYLDNRLGCAVCLRALELLGPTENDVFCVFSAQEEVGLRGAETAAYAIAPELAIAVDICGIPDTPGEKKPNDLKLEGGPVIKIMDAGVICHRRVIDLLEQTALELEMPVQLYATDSGGTDAGSIIRTRGGVPSGVLSIPIRYTHTPNEVADLNVAADCARLLAAAIAG